MYFSYSKLGKHIHAAYTWRLSITPHHHIHTSFSTAYYVLNTHGTHSSHRYSNETQTVAIVS